MQRPPALRYPWRSRAVADRVHRGVRNDTCRPMTKTFRWLIPLAVLIAAAVLYFWLSRPQQEAPEPPPAPPPAQAPAPPSAAETPATPPGIQQPMEAAKPPPTEAAAAPAEPQPLPPLGASDKAVQEALLGLVGKEAVLDFFNVGDYVRRFVVTVDNLPRKRAPVRSWPVNPAPGRFVAERQGARSYLAAENFARYAPFVKLVTLVDTGKVVALYVRFYPLFQEAYEELGYPGKRFNDRLVEVIDHLLAAPDAGDTIELVLPKYDPSIKVERPWIMYEFADPALEARSAGHKILLRVGSENAARLKAKLAEVRKRLAGAGLPRGGARP
ncbi:MAG: DUF3014 domain-containing protein [Burkholderiales bacterium]|nr:DUF3014 domain-containing protein [Burkholderiales bacterium]